MEIELKLKLNKASNTILPESSSFLRRLSEGGRTSREITTYFDTAEHALRKHGLSLRIRSRGKERIQTIKANDGNSVAVSRGEWEWQVEKDTPDLDVVGQTPETNRLLPTLRDELHAIVTTDIERTRCMIQPERGTLIEAAIDRGAIVADDKREPVGELELELHDGDPGALYRLALDLHAEAPVTIAVESKASRGYRLRQGVPASAQKAEAAAYDPKGSVAEALRTIVLNELGHALGNQQAARDGDMEGIHQLRVGVRRVRAALVLFEPVLDDDAVRRFQTELRRIGRVFGEARDWDVFCVDTLGSLSGHDCGWLRLMDRPASIHRATAHRGAAQELDNPAFTALMLALAGWVERARANPQMADDPALQQPLTKIAPRLLTRLSRKVARRGRHLERQSGPALHELRKSLKKLRYGVEFLGPVYASRDVKAFLKHCKRLQQELGTVNDVATTLTLGQRLANQTRPDLAAAATVLARHGAEKRSDALRRLGKQWSQFTAHGPFWH